MYENKNSKKDFIYVMEKNYILYIMTCNSKIHTDIICLVLHKT